MVLAYKRNLTVQTHRESLTLMCELKNEMKVKKWKKFTQWNEV